MRTLAVLAAAVGLLPTASAAAAGPAVNGPVAYSRDGDLFSIALQAPPETRITQDAADNRDPAWSPDASHLAFSSRASGTSDIWTAAGDGTARLQLTHDAAIDSSPAWSPDGTQIAFTTRRSGTSDIWAMAQDGSGQHPLVTAAGIQRQPAWSPDGSRIAFVNGRRGRLAIWVMNADGSGRHLLAAVGVYDTDPAWSPDGSRIAFAAGAAPGGTGIVSVSAAGDDVEAITPAGTGDRHPSWSPDGHQIVVERGDRPLVVDLAGGATQPLFAGFGHSPDWGTVPPATTPPEASQTVNADPAGQVLVKVPGATAAAPLSQPAQVPVGTKVDTTAPGASITLQADAGGGATTQARASLGRFVYAQTGPRRDPVNVLRLPPPQGCSGAHLARIPHDQVSLTVSHRGRRHGNWQVHGPHLHNSGSATSWVTIARCHETITRVTSGVVHVDDLVTGNRLDVPAGRCYIAPSRRPRFHRRCP